MKDTMFPSHPVHLRRFARSPVIMSALCALLCACCWVLLYPTASAQASSGEMTISQAAPSNAFGCTGVYHVVRSGETIGSIARRYGTTAYRIAACNGIGYTVYVGQSLLVPRGRGTAWVVPPLPIDGAPAHR